MESLSTRRRRPLKPATVYGWQHCLNRWILPNLGSMLLSEVRNGALRQFVEILSAAGLAPKTIVNVVTVAKLVVASAVDEEGDQIHPRVWNHESFNFPWSSRKSRIVPRSMRQKYPPHNYGTTWPIVANGARALVWDLSWANWVTKAWSQFARHSSRKPIPRQALEMVAGVRFELTTFGL